MSWKPSPYSPRRRTAPATADAIAQALNMDIGEMGDRMRRMRRSVKEHNIYWWAGSLIGDLCDLRVKG